MDDYGTHKTKLIRNWFAKRPRWHVHYTPTSASWINQVERFFALLTDRAIRRGVFRSVADLEAAITAYIDATNANPKPFRWIKSADDIPCRWCRAWPSSVIGAGSVAVLPESAAGMIQTSKRWSLLRAASSGSTAGGVTGHPIEVTRARAIRTRRGSRRR